jgi:acyl-coenzyme A synthetase/AMP-(fatty) acid ligase/acyl carrier protein
MIEHRNVARLMTGNRSLFDFHKGDVWTLFHSYSFDFSVWEMWGALIHGGRLVIVPEPVTKDLNIFFDLLKTEKVTILNQTPPAFYTLLNTQMAVDSTCLRYVIFGGQALRPIKLKEWKARNPGVKLINMYGITETTVHVTFKEIGDAEIETDISSIGVPLITSEVLLLNRFLQLIPGRGTGEIFVGGDGVGRGYLNRPELTAEKFVADPFSGKKGSRLYRSGDLARTLPNGEWEYIGRADDQVKIKGFRIELTEIESRLLTHGSIRNAIVVVKGDSDDNKYLCAYFVADHEIGVKELKEFLSRTLPGYMIPQHIMRIDNIPVTVNKKIDYRALPDPDAALLGQYVPPSNEVQQRLAAIWAEILNMDGAAIGIETSFFDLGGHSLSATVLLSRVYKEFNVQCSLLDIFKGPTIRNISEIIYAAQWLSQK